MQISELINILHKTIEVHGDANILMEINSGDLENLDILVRYDDVPYNERPQCMNKRAIIIPQP